MQVRIVVDERERSSKIPNLLRQMGITIDFASLAVGDYIVSPETAIERKTINEWLCFYIRRETIRPVLWYPYTALF